MTIMRCFIGVKFPKSVLDKVWKIQEEVKEKELFIGNFTKKENLHLTLKFLGEIDEEKMREVKRRTKKIKFNSVEASLGEIGVFSKNYVKIIWIRVLGEKLNELQKEIDECLSDLFRKEERFMSHLTIARVKKVNDKEKLFRELEKIRVDETKFNVNEFYLVMSDLIKEGPVYKILEKYCF